MNERLCEERREEREVRSHQSPPPQRCPRCVVPMSYGSVKNSDGRDWKYYRCPSTWWTTKCYVTCGADELPEYLQRVHTQTHPCYRDIAPERFVCDCNKSLVMATSRSEKNLGRLYLKCPSVPASSYRGSINRHGVSLRKFSSRELL